MFNFKAEIKGKLSSYICILITFTIVLIFCLFLKGTFLIGEDYDQLFFSHPNFSCLAGAADHGCVLSSLCMKIFGSYIPLKLRIHPNDNFLGVFLRALDFSILFFLISKFASVSTKYKKFDNWYYSLAAVIFTAFFMAYSPFVEVFQTMFVYNRHYRYIFTMIIYLIFWFNFYKIFLFNEIPKGKSFVFLVIIGFCAGISVESVSISTFFSLILFFIFKMIFSLREHKYNLIAALNSLDEDNSAFIKWLKYMAIITSFSIGAYLFYTSSVFVFLAQKRGISNFPTVLHNSIKIFPEFVGSWFRTVFIDEYHWVLTASILILSILILFLKEYRLKNLKVVIFAWILTSGIALFNFSLILSGKTYGDFTSFWLVSKSLNIDTVIVLLTSLFVLFGYYFNKLDYLRKDKSVLNILRGITITIAVLAVCFLLCPKQDYFLDRKQKMINARELMYKIEKMYVFYAEKNKTAVLPDSILSEPIYREEVLGIGGYSTRLAPFVKPYYTYIYNKDKYVSIKILPDDQAMKAFYSLGGVFEPNEIKEAKFTKLLDTDFVLNKKAK